MIFNTLPLLAMAMFLGAGHCQHGPLRIPPIPKNSSQIPNDLQSVSIEFAFFPDYAGNKTQPNHFSKNLLHNLKTITGMAPKVRVGGTSQYAMILACDSAYLHT